MLTCASAGGSLREGGGFIPCYYTLPPPGLMLGGQQGAPELSTRALEAWRRGPINKTPSPSSSPPPDSLRRLVRTYLL
eukprot:4508988-Pyramimonas_sp.AAC.1